jgi:transforming growth factor-beta-induced protein
MRRLFTPPIPRHPKEADMTMQRRTLLLGAALGATTTLLAACGGGDEDHNPLDTIVGVAQANPAFSTLVAAVVRAGLAETLSGDTPLTVFAPTNAAFDTAATALGFTDGEALVAALSPATLASILTYHVAAGRNLSTSLTAGDLPTLYSFEGSATTLGLSLTGGVTLTDALLTTATVTTPDVLARNGVIHVIDKVLVPPGVLNIVQMAQLNSSFSSLVNAVISADLVETLSAASPLLTVFAPVNAAFAAIASTVEGLTPEQLTTVLAHHVVASQVLSSGIPFGVAVLTLAEQDITINNDATAPAIATITDASGSTPAANIVAVDVRASNGVIHVIDKVLLPAS